MRPFTPEMLANRGGVSATTVRNMCIDGSLSHLRLGRLYRIPAAVVEEIEECQISASDGSEAGTASIGGKKEKQKRYQLEARSRAEAEPEAIDIYRREILGQLREKDTVADIWGAYRQDLGAKPTAKTMGYTGKAVLAHFGEFRPDQITTALCRAYVTKREAAGKSQGTAHTKLGHLRSAMHFAVKERIIDWAPEIERPAKPIPKERYLEKDEVSALITSASSPHIALAIHLLFATAGRVGAILDLTWDRVDFQRGTIKPCLDDAKTREGRAIVPMNAGICAALQTAHDAALSDFVVEYA